MTKFQFEAIGTHWEIDIKEDLSESREASLYKKIQDRIEIFDKNYSRFRDDSLVTKISKQAGEYKMPEDFDLMISLYKKAYEITNGLVTPLVGDALVSLGYDDKYTLKRGDTVSALGWDEVLDWQSPILNVKQPTMLDFGACGKGYLVDIVSEIIENDGIKEYIVDASGDMRQRSVGFAKVGLEDPRSKENVIGTVEIKNESLCGSSGNRRAWEGIHHIVNPKTLISPNDSLAIWTIADTTILSDVLTTCLFFVDPEELKKHFDFEYLILKDDLSVQESQAFQAEIFNG